MWNVYGYTLDFINGKVDLEEFKRILNDQRPLQSFIIDCYDEVIKSKYADEFYKDGGISVSINEPVNILKYIQSVNDIETIKTQLKLIIDYYHKIHNL